MLDPSLVQRIEQRLAEGNLRQREIAREFGVDRGTVLAIAKGRWPGRRRKIKPIESSGPVRYCEGCGATVTMPCLLCYLRQRLDQIKSLSQDLARRRGQAHFAPKTPQTEPVPDGLGIGSKLEPLPPGPDDPLRLELKERHRKRYEQVVARREAASAAHDAHGDARRLRSETKRKRIRVAPCNSAQPPLRRAS